MSTTPNTQSDGQTDEQSIENRLDQLAAENERLRNRVTELEDELESRARVTWDGPNPRNLTITASDTGNSISPYAAIMDRPDQDEYDRLDARLTAIEKGEADIVVRSETSHDTLPMEAMVAARQHGTGDLTVNQRRATLVFAAFGGEAESWSGKLRLDSHGVRRILSKKTNRDDWNSNTIKRIMKQTAKHTSRADDSEDRDPFGEDNLITLQKGDKRLELVADLEEWKDWYREVTGGDGASVTVS